MALFNGTVDDLIIQELKNIDKYIDGAINLKIVLERNDNKILEDMEDEKIWLKRPQSKKILA